MAAVWSPPRGSWAFVLKALRGRGLWPGSKVIYLFQAVQVTDGTAHVGMLRFVSMFFQLGVEVQDSLRPLRNKPGARVRHFKAGKEQGSLDRLVRVPTVSLAHSI